MKTLPFGLILMGLPRKNINGFYELELVIILKSVPFIYLFRPPFINSKVSGYTDSVFSVENSYFYFTPPTEFRIFHCIEKMLWKKRLFWVKRWKRIWLIEPMQKYVRLHFSSRFSFKKEKKSWKICWLMFSTCLPLWWAFVKVKFFYE